MEKYEEFITWSTYSGMLAGGLHSVIQDWRVLKIVKKIKKNLEVQWNLYACVHAVKIWKIQTYENVAVVYIFTHSYM